MDFKIYSITHVHSLNSIAQSDNLYPQKDFSFYILYNHYVILRIG